MIYNKQCYICGAEFKAIREQAKYCSAECRKKAVLQLTLDYKRSKENIRKCSWCGKQFNSKNKAQYCSPACKKKNEDLKTQKKQCRRCKYRYETRNDVICDYINIKGKSRNCGINPCAKFEVGD